MTALEIEVAEIGVRASLALSWERDWPLVSIKARFRQARDRAISHRRDTFLRLVASGLSARQAQRRMGF